MKKFSVPLSLVFPLVFMCGIPDVHAMTLGHLQGAVLLGKTLDLSVAVQSSPEEELNLTCFTAEVFYGDAQQEPSKVVVTASIAGGARLQSVRVQSAIRVDEPVVTVYLKSTCGQKTTRKYVVLADLPSEPNLSAVLPKNPDLDGVKVQQRNVTLETALASAKIKDKSPSSNTSKGDAAPADGPKNNRPARLKLDSLGALLDRDPVLKSTIELATAPLDDLQKRVEALATWRALNASAQDVLRDEARMQSLEGAMKSLTDASIKQRKSVEEISNRLAESESQRYSNPLIYGLMVALLACFGGLAFLWTRRANFRERTPWWRGELAQESMYEPAASDSLAANRPGGLGKFNGTQESPRKVNPPTAEKSTVVQSVDIDLDLGGVSPSGATSQVSQFNSPPMEARDSEFSSFSRRDFGLSLSGALRYVNTKEMLDVRQQAEFFMALGRHDEAIAVLESGIARTADANPLVYLDLLKLFHTLSRKSDFDLCREKFNQLFTCLVPIYTNFHLSGNSLDAYPQICAKIADLWPTSQAIEYIEFCLVRTPADAPEQGFDMEAYQDLLLLDSIAKQLDAPNVTTVAPFSASVGSYAGTDDTTSLGADRFGTASTVSLPVIFSQTTGIANNVDLDLSDLDGNLIDFDISHYENSSIDTLGGDAGPAFQAGASDEPAGHQD
jgi:pilus assembly protein FimV